MRHLDRISSEGNKAMRSPIPTAGVSLHEPYISIHAASAVLQETWRAIEDRLPGDLRSYLLETSNTCIVPVRMIRDAFPAHPIWRQFGVGRRLPARMKTILLCDAAGEPLQPDDAALVVFTVEYGTLPDSVSISRTCDDPTCTDPQHLFIDVPAHEFGDGIPGD